MGILIKSKITSDNKGICKNTSSTVENYLLKHNSTSITLFNILPLPILNLPKMSSCKRARILNTLFYYFNRVLSATHESQRYHGLIPWRSRSMTQTISWLFYFKRVSYENVKRSFAISNQAMRPCLLLANTQIFLYYVKWVETHIWFEIAGDHTVRSIKDYSK